LLDPESGIGVEHDVLNSVVIEETQDSFPELASEFYFQTLALLALYDR
jgi:hypothetical protein